MNAHKVGKPWTVDGSRARQRSSETESNQSYDHLIGKGHFLRLMLLMLLSE
ncbi:unnamed protein product [Sphenostylis stenocarpa]|uniref:Uncharacterized protein n=1 Tax=Sphenostylis stenocarpa TaxID=92480 RepID=A0AA86VCU0_9FABA|nr:unnamed protein product [Sphenostylis stenocarpa]